MSTLEEEAVLFCRALRLLTNARPLEWRSVKAVAEQASLTGPAQIEAAVNLARIRGRLWCENGQSVMLTDDGRRV